MLGSAWAQETGEKAVSAPAQKMPEYFGVFARLKDGSLVELDKRPIYKTKWIEGDTIASMQLVTAPLRDFTLNPPKVELDLALVDHFLYHFDQGIGDKNQWLNHFYSVQGLRGKFFDTRGKPPTPFHAWDAFLSLNMAHGSEAGVRISKAGENLYKLILAEGKNWAAIQEEMIAGSGPQKRTIPVAVAGLLYADHFYQFRVKRPEIAGPKLTAFTLDLAAYRPEKPPGSEVGEALRIGESDGKTVLKANEGGKLAPRNLALAGDFTVKAEVGYLSVSSFSMSVASEKTAHHLSLANAKTFTFAGKNTPIPLEPNQPKVKLPKALRSPSPPPKPFLFTFQRKADTLTVSCNTTLLGTIPLPASEIIQQAQLAGFAEQTAVHSFRITSP
jgi:hypothetical protein